MAGLVPAIHGMTNWLDPNRQYVGNGCIYFSLLDVDARDKRGHDGSGEQ
jgi:hypothetical protein